MIQIRDLEFKYEKGNGVPVLKDINLEIREGEFVGLIGPNGSGKSTLGKHLNALLLPSSGDVIINGMNTKDEKNTFKIRETVGMVFQNPENQIVGNTVYEDVIFGPKNLGLEENLIKLRTDEVLEKIGFKNKKNVLIQHLSCGEKQLVSIASCLVMKPKVIVFDEPTSMLDRKNKNIVKDFIRRLKNGETTLIYITHNTEEVLDADRVIILYQGRILYEGKPEDVLEKEGLEEYGVKQPIFFKLKGELNLLGLNINDDILKSKEYSC